MTQMRTPLGQIQGLGSAKSGTAHFVYQRMTGAMLVPLSLWFVVFALTLVGASRESVASFLGLTHNAVLMFLFVSAALYHMTLGVQVIIEDYVHCEAVKLGSVMLVRFAAFAMAAAAGLALVKLALAGA